MTEYHHRSAHRVVKSVLEKWRSNVWKGNDFISSSITLANTPFDFPSPDADCEDAHKKTRISFEFKPYTETKRGIMTGLGQTIAYLLKANASYLISPSRIDNFDMEKFLVETFNRFITGKIPVGLIIYDGEQLENIRLVCEISSQSTEIEKRDLQLTEEPYWCWWRDAPPDAFLKLAISAENTPDEDERSKKVWDYFWDNYYAIQATRDTIDDVESLVSMFDGTKMVPFQTLKKNLRTRVGLNEITVDEALEILEERGWGKNTVENNYQNYKKNYTIPMKHINFWDENKKLTPLGKKFLERNRNNNEPSKIVDEFAQIILVEGKHENLIEDIERISQIVMTNDTCKNSAENYINGLYDRLDKSGFISKNPQRATTYARTFLQAEKQLWRHFGILKMSGNSFFTPDIGLVFDRDRINNLVSQFYENYSSVCTFIDAP